MDVTGGDADRQIRAFQPIREAGPTIGVFETDHDCEPLVAHTREMRVFAAVSLVGFSGVLYLLLFGLVKGAADEL